MKNIRFVPTALGLMFCLLATSAFAQYVWLDEKGVKQFSDMPPPASVPQSRILKQPGAIKSQTGPENSDQPSDNATKQPATQQKPPMTTAEQNAEFRKRRADQAEKEKKAADEAKRQAEKAKNCERAQDYQRGLESGERISRTDKNGERVYLSDEQRERELQEARRILSDCK
jgi:hypothetical protein